MKKSIAAIISFLIILSLSACSRQEQELADMTTLDCGGYTAIVWDKNTYVPYCAIQRGDCGKQIGIVNSDKDDRVYEYKGYSSDEWIINAYTMDGAMLYREINVTDIPEGLQSEYEWNNASTEMGIEEFPPVSEDSMEGNNSKEDSADLQLL